MNLNSFEIAFKDMIGSCRGTCACWKVYYNPDLSWDWKAGELETLEHTKNEKVIALDHPVGFITFEGTTYVLDCNCWHKRAEMIMKFLDAHMQEIADYFSEEKKRKYSEYEKVPNVVEVVKEGVV